MLLNAYYSQNCASIMCQGLLNRYGIYDFNGWDIYGEVSYCFQKKNKTLVFRGVPFPIIV